MPPPQSAADHSEPSATELVRFTVVDRLKVTYNPREEKISKLRVACQRWTVHVGSDNVSGSRSVESGAVPVTNPTSGSAKRRRSRSERRDPGMVLVAAQKPGKAQFRSRFDGELADCSAPTRPRVAVEKADSRCHCASGTAKRTPDDLKSCAHGEDNGASSNRLNERAGVASGSELARSKGLRQVLASSHDVQVAAGGYRLPGPYDVDIRLEASPEKPLSQDCCVPGVTVGAKQVRKKQAYRYAHVALETSAPSFWRIA